MEDKFIESILFNDSENNAKSTLLIAIRGARYLANRNLESGLPNKDEERLKELFQKKLYTHNKFIALTNYLIIIDLIGNIFCIEDKREYLNDRFKQCLEHFTSINDEIIIKSLKNLRSSLAHSFSLGNRDEIFAINFTNVDDKILLRKPKKLFHRKLREIKGKKESENYTEVNYNEVCNLVEEIFQSLYGYYQNGKLKINGVFRNNPTDFNSRFLIK